jgi:hypothetical protein
MSQRVYGEPRDLLLLSVLTIRQERVPSVRIVVKPSLILYCRLPQLVWLTP